jgi:hypothetical protein
MPAILFANYTSSYRFSIPKEVRKYLLTFEETEDIANEGKPGMWWIKYGTFRYINEHGDLCRIEGDQIDSDFKWPNSCDWDDDEDTDDEEEVEEWCEEHEQKMYDKDGNKCGACQEEALAKKEAEEAEAKRKAKEEEERQVSSKVSFATFEEAIAHLDKIQKKERAAERARFIRDGIIFDCSLCSQKYPGYGNNPAPLPGESCCDACNITKVIPARMNAKYTK